MNQLVHQVNNVSSRLQCLTGNDYETKCDLSGAYQMGTLTGKTADLDTSFLV